MHPRLHRVHQAVLRLYHLLTIRPTREKRLNRKEKKIKKLDLHTETLRNLSKLDLEHAGGGATGTRPCSLCTHVCSTCFPCA